MGLHRDGTVRHGTSDASSDDLVPRFNLFKWDGLSFVELELEDSTKSSALDLLVRILCIRIVSRLVLLANCILKAGNALGVVDVGLATITPMILSRLWHTGREDGIARGPTPFVKFEGVHGEKIKCGTLHTTSSTSEALLHNLFVQAESLEDLSTFVRLQCRNTHF